MSEPPDSAQRRRSLVLLVLRILGTAAGFTYILLVADLDQTWDALARTPLWTLAAGLGLMLVNVGAAALRWQTMFRIYGAELIPGLGRLYRGYLIGLFYNTFLPGGPATSSVGDHPRRACDGRPPGSRCS
jgi:uncharacterized membrane protein YbhN (UPF0104 family)